MRVRDGGTLRTKLTNRTAQSPSSHANQTYGAETFEDYMQQFMSTKVHYKDFQTASLHKFDLSKQESFIHWYKLFCATCLQWSIWCPPYESVLEDHIHGCWWNLLPALVQSQVVTFMSSLLYSALSSENIFPPLAVMSMVLYSDALHMLATTCHTIYAILRPHHPCLQTILNTVNKIPHQRCAEIFCTYLRRLHDVKAQERIAGCNYSKYEALDLCVRTLSSKWRSEFCCLVERDQRTGCHKNVLPFHLTIFYAQLATTFVQCACEIGQNIASMPPPSSCDCFLPSIVRLYIDNVIDGLHGKYHAALLLSIFSL
jgi:hypothetical protein